MIICHKYKFLFIGLPFSASSAISKELYLHYKGEALLRKHSLYHEFKKVSTNEESDYFVFAVLRNPMDIAVTVYEKMRANTKGNFNNPRLFTENGGHITRNHRAKFNFINDKKATFQEYFKHFFKVPYDSLASLTINHCDYIIRYENIDNDYLLALKKAGVTNPRSLPIANKTAGKKNDISFYYTDDIKEQAISIFGPFLQKYNYCFPEEWGQVKLPITSRIQFNILSFIRKVNYRYFKTHTQREGLKGTIYGDIQRKNLKDPS